MVPKLPPGVDDIDDEDLENPQLCSEYAKVVFYAKIFFRGVGAFFCDRNITA